MHVVASFAGAFLFGEAAVGLGEIGGLPGEDGKVGIAVEAGPHGHVVGIHKSGGGLRVVGHPSRAGVPHFHPGVRVGRRDHLHVGAAVRGQRVGDIAADVVPGDIAGGNAAGPGKGQEKMRHPFADALAGAVGADGVHAGFGVGVHRVADVALHPNGDRLGGVRFAAAAAGDAAGEQDDALVVALHQIGGAEIALHREWHRGQGKLGVGQRRVQVVVEAHAPHHGADGNRAGGDVPVADHFVEIAGGVPLLGHGRRRLGFRHGDIADLLVLGERLWVGIGL